MGVLLQIHVGAVPSVPQPGGALGMGVLDQQLGHKVLGSSRDVVPQRPIEGVGALDDTLEELVPLGGLEKGIGCDG